MSCLTGVRDHPRKSAARRWLERTRDQKWPGFGDGDDRMARSMTFYRLAAAARNGSAGHHGTHGDAYAFLRSRQQPDGSWQNPSNLMKEDDLLVATPLALIALATTPPPGRR